MITYVKGDLLEADVEALVNTVNCVGVMGKGIALAFKHRFPDNFRQYEDGCARRVVEIGKMFVVVQSSLFNPRWIVNFPTKAHWKDPSHLSWIERGLEDLYRTVIEKKISSIAIPPLGCGNGGLDWRDVRPMIEDAFKEVVDVDVRVYGPGPT